MKRIVIILAFSLITIPLFFPKSASAANYDPGPEFWSQSLMHKNEEGITYNNSTKYSITENLHDGNTNTSAHLGYLMRITIEFPEERYIGKYIVFHFGLERISLTDSSGSLVDQNYVYGSPITKSINKRVKKIDFYTRRGNGAELYEFGAFTDDSVDLPPDPATMPPGELKNVSASPTDHSIKYSFQLPTDSDFKQVNVYDSEGTLVGSATESNYTINGLDIETEYTYKFKTVDTDGNESKGISVTAKTLKPPPPKLDGIDYDHNDNGDLIVHWDEPTKGQIKVVVGGKDYVTVPASQKQVVIPKKDIVKDAMGNDDVKLIPIGEDGQTGDTVKKPTEIDKVKMPFGASDLLSTSGELLLLVGGFLLLALSFLVVPKLRKSIAEGLKDGRKPREERTYREGKEPRQERISAKEERQPRVPKQREERQRHEYRASARDD